jgi:hypothetical protein
MQRSLKYVIMIGAVFIMLAMPAVAQAKHPDYRPWKAAMLVWFDDWATHEWLRGVDWSLYDDQFVTVETPRGFRYWTNNWSESTRQLAQFITAIVDAPGMIPNGQFNPLLKDILRPYLGMDPEAWPPQRIVKRQVLR